MSRYRRARVAGGTYFFTLVTERRQPLLTQPDVRHALREAIIDVRRTRPFHILGWVLLPDHLHAIWKLPEGDADYSTRWKLIKRHVTRTCGSHHPRPDLLSQHRSSKGHGTFWQHRFWEHLIRDEDDLQRHLDYLHGNPLKHSYVANVADWPWSSFHRCVKDGTYPIGWGGELDLDMPEGTE